MPEATIRLLDTLLDEPQVEVEVGITQILAD